MDLKEVYCLEGISVKWFLFLAIFAHLCSSPSLHGYVHTVY